MKISLSFLRDAKSLSLPARKQAGLDKIDHAAEAMADNEEQSIGTIIDKYDHLLSLESYGLQRAFTN